MDRLNAKILTGILMLFAILICFLLPLRLNIFFKKRGDKGQYYLDLLACFAGGVFLAVYLIFMAPAVRELILINFMKPMNISYPIPDVLVGLGFFILLLLNRIVVSISEAYYKSVNSSDQGIASRTSEPYAINHHSHMISPPPSKSTELSDSMLTPSSETAPFRIRVDSETITEREFRETCDGSVYDPNNPYPLARRCSIEEVARQVSMTRSIVFMLALSIDSVLEGVTTGFKTTTAEVIAIFIGNLVHETVIAFCLGLQLIRAHESNQRLVIWSAVAYSLMNPFGLLVSTLIYELNGTSSEMDLASGLLQGLTAGCFIYVTFCEILEGQITHRVMYSKICAMFLGFCSMALFALVPDSTAYSLDLINACAKLEIERFNLTGLTTNSL